VHVSRKVNRPLKRFAFILLHQNKKPDWVRQESKGGSGLQDSEYNDRVDEIFATLEDQLDEQPADLDVEVSGPVMTIIFPNQNQIILSRQVAN
jgi:hypothetical protein